MILFLCLFPISLGNIFKKMLSKIGDSGKKYKGEVAHIEGERVVVFKEGGCNLLQTMIYPQLLFKT